MSEQPIGVSSEGDQDPTQFNHFRADVMVSDLHFVIEGDAPDSPTRFELVVSLPDDKWADIKPKIDEQIANNAWFAGQYKRLQQSLKLGNGRVGSVWVSEATTEDGAKAIGVSRIQTDSMYMPEDNEYHDVDGVGSFLLDSLCAIADLRDWRIYLEPLDRGGKLMQDQLVDWYERHGFENYSPDNVSKHSSFGGMVRFPRQVDPSQPIVALLVA